MTLPHDVEEAELLAAAGGAGTGGGGGDDDGGSSTAPDADAAPTAAAAINEEGEAASSQQQQQQPRRPRRRHSSSPTRFSVERHSGAILEDLMAVMGLDGENSSLGGNGGSTGPFNPWGSLSRSQKTFTEDHLLATAGQPVGQITLGNDPASLFLLFLSRCKYAHSERLPVLQ